MKKAKSAPARTSKSKKGGIRQYPARLWAAYKRWWHAKLWHKLVAVLLAILVFFTTCAFGISQWYIFKHRNDPLRIGVTFIPSYARYFDLDAQQTMDAFINDLGFRRFRLVSYWDKGEPVKGQYDFSELDWQFKKVEAVGGKVSLAIGLRQPRWPECHMPGWAIGEHKQEWVAQLKAYMTAVVNRYKDSPALDSYQLENEYFLNVFGDCYDFSRQRLIDEFNMVKALDNQHPIVISRSNNAVPSWPIGEPRADINAASIYKRVWDRTITKRYFEYPFPPWFYAFLAGATELTTGRNTIIHEMQTEAWPPDGIKNASIAEQNKSFDASRMDARIQYGLDTGMRTIDMWGAEWWYWRKEKMNDPSLWNAAKAKLQSLDVTHNY